VYVLKRRHTRADWIIWRVSRWSLQISVNDEELGCCWDGSPVSSVRLCHPGQKLMVSPFFPKNTDDLSHRPLQSKVMTFFSCCLSNLLILKAPFLSETVFNHCDVIDPKLLNWVKQCKNGHYAVQGHLRSQILVPIESPYATLHPIFTPYLTPFPGYGDK